MNITELKDTLSQFADRLKEALFELGIYELCMPLSVDHICIRLDTTQSVDEVKESLLKDGSVISQATINGRDIFIIQLRTPLSFGTWSISGIELPYPKLPSTYQNGWEHVEFILPKAENTAAGIQEAFSTCFPKLSVKSLIAEYEYKVDEPHSKTDQMPNPTIGLRVNGVGIKFHAQSIQEVVGFKE